MLKTPFWHAVKWPLFFVVVLWIIESMAILTGIRLSELGILPRTISGIPGIILSPFVHGNYEHLLSNTLPLLVVGSGLVFFYNDISKNVIVMIWLFTGFWVWLAARDNIHIGASGLIYGLVCFLFLSGILRKDTRLLSVSLLVTFLYGSMVWGILPVDQTISWESHLSGSIAGFFCAIYFRNMGPQKPKSQWEIDEEMEALQNAENGSRMSESGSQRWEDGSQKTEEGSQRTEDGSPLKVNRDDNNIRINYTIIPKDEGDKNKN